MGSGAAWVALARRAEELGYASLLMPDRPSLGGLALFSALAFAAAATSSLHVGSYVFCNDYRHPALLAKEVATLDQLSGGRFELGLGAGVNDQDYKQLGLPFESPGTRVKRLEEAVQIIKQFFAQEEVNFAGSQYTISGLKALPVAAGRPPIFIGSGGKRVLTMAAREVDIIAPTVKSGPQGVDPADVPLTEKIAWIRAAAGERFSQLELACVAYNISIMESGTQITVPPGLPLSIKVRSMSTEQAVDFLLEQRERYGFSYIQVFDGQIENFAPVVARLNGK